MAKEKLKPLLTSFSHEGDYLAVLCPNGTVKIWNTSNGSLLAEWKQSDDTSAAGYSCMALSVVGKKRKKEHNMCLLALGTKDGSVFAIDALTGEIKWKSMECHSGGLAALSFVKKGQYLCIVGTNGVLYEINSETGERTKNLKVLKRPISASAFSHDEKFIAVEAGKMRILELENGKEILKFPTDLGSVQYISLSEDAKTIIISEAGEKNIQIWSCDLNSNIVSRGPVLTMPHPSLAFECKSSSNGQAGPVVLAVSESGSAYVWDLRTFPDKNVNASKIAVKSKKSIFAGRLCSIEADERVVALVAYGSVDSPKFRFVEISEPGKNIVITAKDEAEAVQENGISAVSEVAVTPAFDKKANKKRAAPDPDVPTTRGVDDTAHDEDKNGVLVDDPNEPTMGEKLESLKLLDNDKGNSHEREAAPQNSTPPSADSVIVLLKQALHANDRALLLDCLYNRDEKVIANSVAQLNPSDVFKLLNSLVSIIQSRGAVLACALPWIKSLLLQHAGGIMSQESSLLALNSVYQLIESRVSTYKMAVEVSSCLDFLYSGVVGDVKEEADTVPLIYEDKDESDEEEETEDAMETDDEDEEEADGSFDEGVDKDSGFEGIDDMSD